MQITLTRVFRSKTKRDGTPLVTSTGKPYTSLRIQCNEYGDKWLSGFDGQQTSSWKEGDTVEVEVEQKGDYLNFSVPKKSGGGGLPDNQLALLKQAASEAYNARLAIQALSRALRDCGVLKDVNSDGSKVPDFEPTDLPDF